MVTNYCNADIIKSWLLVWQLTTSDCAHKNPERCVIVGKPCYCWSSSCVIALCVFVKPFLYHDYYFYFKCAKPLFMLFVKRVQLWWYKCSSYKVWSTEHNIALSRVGIALFQRETEQTVCDRGKSIEKVDTSAASIHQMEGNHQIISLAEDGSGSLPWATPFWQNWNVGEAPRGQDRPLVHKV